MLSGPMLDSNRRDFGGPPRFAPPRPCPPLARDAQDPQAALDALNNERFCDTAPAAVRSTRQAKPSHPSRQPQQANRTTAYYISELWCRKAFATFRRLDRDTQSY